MTLWLVAIGIVGAIVAIPVAAITLLFLAGHARHQQRVRKNREEVKR